MAACSGIVSKVGRYSLNSSNGSNIDGKEELELEEMKESGIQFSFPQLSICKQGGGFEERGGRGQMFTFTIYGLLWDRRRKRASADSKTTLPKVPKPQFKVSPVS